MGCCSDMHFLGVVSISDPVDPSVPDAINQAEISTLLSMSTPILGLYVDLQLRSDTISICVATGDQRATTEWAVHRAGIAPETSRAIEVLSMSLRPVLSSLRTMDNLWHCADQ